MKLVTAIGLATTLMLLSDPSSAADPARIAAAKRALAQAVNGKDNAPLVKARAAFESMSAAEPKSALLHYWIAVADWRLVPRLGDSKQQAERYCKDGIAQADQALKLDPGFAEALAIKVGLQGMWTQFDPQNMMTIGMEMEQTMGRALTIAPNGPRVAFIDALNTLYKPTFVGGGADKALPKFKHTIELFAADSTRDSTAADWGRDDAFLWTGRTAMRLDDYEAARGYYQQALEVNPDNRWVRFVLLPEVDKAVAAKAGEKTKP